MKHFWISLSLFAALLALTIYTTIALEKRTAETIAALQQARMHADLEDYPSAHQAIEHASDSWDDLEGLLGVLQHHGETDEIKFAFAALLACAEDPDSGELLIRCDELLAMLQHISELEKPYYYNILTAKLPSSFAVFLSSTGKSVRPYLTLTQYRVTISLNDIET